MHVCCNMGKAPLVDPNKKYKVLQKINIFNNDGSLKKGQHPVWKEVRNKLKQYKKNSVYLDVLNDRNSLKTDLLEHFIEKGVVQLRKDILTNLQATKVDKNTDTINDSQVIECKNDKDYNDISKLEAIINLHENIEASMSNDACDENLSASQEFDNDSTDDFCIKNHDRDPNPQNFPPFNFTITLDENEWKIIKPVNYKMPKHVWTPVIYAKIVDSTPLRCGFMFEVGTVYKVMPDKYIDFYGYCGQTDCQTYIYGVCRKKPTNDKDGITFEMSTYNTTSLYHSIKRPFTSIRRKEAAKKLVYMSAEHYRNEMVHDLMSFSEEQERPDIPSGANLRTVKAEGLREYLGISGPKDPIKCLLFMMDEFNFIQEVCLKPFRVWYCFDNQIKLWDESAPLNPVLKLDATGGLVKKVTIDEEPSAYIYLYQLMTNIQNNYAPLSQMICSRHDTNAINYWLNAWKRKIKVLPKEIVSDDGLALLYSLCETFNDCTYKYYLSACIKILQGNKEIPPLKCHMGLDRAHITKTPSNWKCVKAKNDQTFTDFITRCVALASISTTLAEVKKVFLASFVVFESKTMVEKSVCDEKYEWLMDQFENFGLDSISGEKVHGDENENNENAVPNLNNSAEEIDMHMEYNTVKEYIQAIHKEALALIKLENETVVTDENKNTFYCTDIIDNLFFLYSQFPLWTNTMRAYFNSSNKVATSADLESYFKDLKNEFNLKNILGPHTFVMYHGRIVDGQVKIAHCALKKFLNQKNNSTTDENISKLQSILSSIIQETEPITSVKYTTQQIVQTNATVQVEDNKNVQIIKKVTNTESHNIAKVENNNAIASKASPNDTKFHSHLRNGHLDENIEIKLDTKVTKVTIANTCAYDSGMSLLSFGYEKSDRFKRYIDEKVTSNGLFFGSIAGYCNETMNMTEFYKNRGVLLVNFLFQNESKSYYSCICNVNTLLAHLLKEELSCSKDVHCNKCGHRRVDKFRILTVNDENAAKIIEGGSANVIRDCIMDLFHHETLYCRKCRNPEKTVTATPSLLGSFLVIDIDKVFEDFEISWTVADIPTFLLLQGTKYILSGFIAHISGGLGHYIAYCYDSTADRYEIKDDTQTRSYFCKTIPQNLVIATIIYVITDH